MLRLSEHAAQFHGSLLIKDMERLLPSLYNSEGTVDVDLKLDVDAEKTKFCHVRLKTDVVLQCQRCMKPFTYGIMSDFLQGIVTSEQEAEGLSEQYEPVIAPDGVLVILGMIEDELILKLPIVPMHEASECEVRLPVVDSTWKEEESNNVQNPFNVLQFLKREKK
ncbi:MAG TPA: YceD family protein [Gammaproteobacteria bacterium]|nr:YceD family protein [Gammaproteobacteria bacterium]